MWLARAILACSLAFSVTGLGRFGYYQDRLRHKIVGDLKFDNYVETQWFEQKLDHFNDSNTATWQQRYYNNDKFATSNGPQFLMIGGEGEESGYLITTPSAIQYWAKEFGANLWDIEHRYYGESIPVQIESAESYKYLSSRQALADIANFIEAQNANLSLTNPKWIVFGGSYPGSLALWFRALYPHLAIGAIGSSAPLEAKIDFYEYLEVTEYAFRNYSPSCSNEIQKAFTDLEANMEYKEGRDLMSKLFLIEDDNLSPKYFEDFYDRIISPFQEAAQYGYLDTVCNTMTNPNNTAIENLAKVHPRENGIFILGDSWTWQVCTEFGWFTTSDSGKSFFGSVISPNEFLDMCTETLGPEYNANFLQDGIERTNAIYGGVDNYNGTNVIAFQGTYDPWSALGLKKASDPSVIPFVVPTAYHCNDMDWPKESDTEEMKELRNLTYVNIKKWLEESHGDNSTIKPETTITENWVHQSWDHFNLNDSRSFKQRYWRNSRYAKQDSPIFLVLGGPHSESSDTINDETLHSQWAKKFEADLYLLEHRFYGASLPSKNLTIETLVYLSSKQVLADIAHFIETINTQKDLKTPKWMIFGGSFAGALTAWFREVYPKHSIGAVASSAPLKLKLDAFEIVQQVGQLIHDFNGTCYDRIKEAFVEIESKLYTIADRKYLDDLFKTTKPLGIQSPNVKDIHTFLYYLYVPIGAEITNGIPNMCNEMMNTSRTPIEAYQHVYSSPISSDYNKEIENAIQKNSARSFLWQRCTEFGLFPTTDSGSNNIFGIAVPIDYFIDLCTDVFGPTFVADSIDHSIAATANFYGGASNYKGSNIIFVNGGHDPWHVLSLAKNATTEPESVRSIWIEDGTHCQDMLPPGNHDSQDLVKAREEIENAIHTWLQ